MADCKNCIHIEVCKSADSCDGRVPGCRHFEPKQKHGRWIDEEWGDWRCSYCRKLYTFDDYGDVHPLDDCGYNYCPNCGAIMDLPSITEQTTKAHGGE